MKRFLIILAAAAAVILSGCHKEVTDAINDMNNTKVDFTYSVSGMTVSCTPQCDTKVTGFEWWFGEEMTTRVSHPTFTFKTAGTHKVRLTGKWYADGKARTKECVKEVTINPSGGGGWTNMYVKGFRMDQSSYKNFYYKFKCTGADAFDIGMLNAETPYSTSKISTFPYTYIFPNPIMICSPSDLTDWYKTFTIGAYILLMGEVDSPVIEKTINASELSGKSEYSIVDGQNKLTLLIEYK